MHVPTKPVVLCALALLLAGCSKPKVRHTLNLAAAPRDVQVRVTVAGRELPPVRGTDTVVSVALGEFHEPPVVKAEALLPCGWVELKVRAVGGTETDQRHVATVVEDATKVLGIWIDNRGGGELNASLGQVKLAVAAGFTRGFHVPAPACPEGAQLKVGEQLLGTVAQASELPLKESRTAPAYLVDQSGERCYHSRMVNYRPGFGVSLEPLHDERLRPARFHALVADVDFFLKPAPEKLDVKPGEIPFFKRHELTDTPCS